jgi:hypothetical protein
MKKIVTLLLFLGINLFAFTNQYNINYENIVDYKLEMGDIERGCSIQRDKPSKFKYFKDLYLSENGVVDTVGAEYVQSSGNSFVALDELLNYEELAVVHTDIKCLIYEGAVFASAIKRGKTTIIQKNKKGSAPKLGAVNDNKNLVWDKRIGKMFKRAWRDSQTLNCKMTDQEIMCNNRSIVLNLQSLTLTYKGIVLYSDKSFYGYGISRNNSLIREDF